MSVSWGSTDGRADSLVIVPSLYPPFANHDTWLPVAQAKHNQLCKGLTVCDYLANTDMSGLMDTMINFWQNNRPNLRWQIYSWKWWIPDKSCSLADVFSFSDFNGFRHLHIFIHRYVAITDTCLHCLDVTLDVWLAEICLVLKSSIPNFQSGLPGV
jgi:hypothetical protein